MLMKVLQATRTTLPQELHMDGTTILIIVGLILLLGGGGFYGRGRWYGRR